MILATCQHHILKTYTVQIEFRTVVRCLVDIVVLFAMLTAVLDKKSFASKKG